MEHRFTEVGHTDYFPDPSSPTDGEGLPSRFDEYEVFACSGCGRIAYGLIVRGMDERGISDSWANLPYLGRYPNNLPLICDPYECLVYSIMGA